MALDVEEWEGDREQVLRSNYPVLTDKIPGIENSPCVHPR